MSDRLYANALVKLILPPVGSQARSISFEDLIALAKSTKVSVDGQLRAHEVAAVSARPLPPRHQAARAERFEREDRPTDLAELV